MVSSTKRRKASPWLQRCTAWPVAVFALAAAILLTGPPLAVAQTFTETATATELAPVTSSGSLNAPSKTEGVASPTASAPEVTQTTIPDFDFSGPQVPFLFQRPLPREDNPQRNRMARPRMEDIYFSGCSNRNEMVDPELRFNISAVYLQFDNDLSRSNVLAEQNDYSSGVLRITAVGATNAVGLTADGQVDRAPLSTLSVETDFLTFQLFSNNSYLCDSLYPTRPDPENQLIIPAGCLYGPGQVSLGVGIPLNDTYTLGSLWTRIRLSDTSNPPKDIACIEVHVSPYDENKWYWQLILWFPIALTIGYLVIVSLARILTALSSRAKAFRSRAREGSQPNVIKDTIAPTIVASLSGQQLALTSSLLRYATPGCWDIILHTQFVAALAMIAVRWPEFSYPFFKQAAWATLVGNTTIIRPEALNAKFDPHKTSTNLPVGDIADQITNPSSALYMNESRPNVFLNLNGARSGIEAFAQMVGLRNRDLFGTCLSIWLIIAAVAVALSAAFWIVDSIHDTLRRMQKRKEDGVSMSPLETADVKAAPGMDDDGVARSSLSRRGGYKFLGHSTGRIFGSSNNTIHLRLLHGNLARLVVLFHLPITIFTTYHMKNSGNFSVTSLALAGVAFAFLSVLTPGYLIFRIARTPTAKLYDSIGTLSAFGPLYNTYSPGSQLFCAVDLAHTFVLGVVVGVGQKSGTVQAIIILVLEVLFALACSLWLPWGDGAMMGPVSFVASVLRIITAVLVVLLSPLVDFGRQAIEWLTYVILLIQGILYVCAALILLIKIIEALVRLIGKAPFDERSSPRSSGLGGACREIRTKRQTLQLGKSGKRQSLNRSGSTSTQAMVLAGAAKSGSLGTGNGISASTPGSPRAMTTSLPSSASRMPMHSRKASYASYLDNQLYGRKSPADYLNDSNSPYSTYLRGDPNDEGFIMAAMPPHNGPPTSSWAGGGLGRAASSPPTSGFVRTGGGKATDASPYQTVITPSGPGAGRVSIGSMSRSPSEAEVMQMAAIGASGSTSRRPRPQSQSVVIESYRDHRTSFPDFSGEPIEMSSTQTAALDASGYKSGAQLANSSSIAGLATMDEETGPGVGRRKRKGFFRRSGGGDLEDSSDEDDEDYGAFQKREPIKSQGGWRGIGKMSAAFGALTSRLGGGGANQTQEASLEPVSEDGAQSKGFEVVRAPRPRRSSAAAEQALYSTAMAVASASVAAPQRPQQATAAPYQMPAFEPLATKTSAGDTYDPSSGTLPPGAGQQALLLPQHAPQTPPAAPQQPLPRSEEGEDTFWIAPESQTGTRPSTSQSLARQDRLAQPQSAEVFESVDDLNPDRQWFDTEGKLNANTINFDGGERPRPQQQVYDAAQAYR